MEGGDQLCRGRRGSGLPASLPTSRARARLRLVSPWSLSSRSERVPCSWPGSGGPQACSPFLSWKAPASLEVARLCPPFLRELSPPAGDTGQCSALTESLSLPQLYPACLLHGSHGASSCPVPDPGLPGPVLSGNFRDLVLPGNGLTWRRRSDWKSRGRRAWFFCPLTRGKPELVLGPHGVGSGKLTPGLLPDGPGGPARAEDVTPSVRPRAPALLPSFTTTFGHPSFVTFPGSWASAGWQQAPSLREHRGSGPAWG